MERDVVVAGAGPVGLTAALAVRALGRPVTVVEAGAADRVRPGSRAIFIHRASLGILERIKPGLGHEFNAHGLAWTVKRTLYRGREVFYRSYPAPPAGRLPAATSLPQVVSEQVLLRHAIEAGVEFVWDAPVERVVASRVGARVEIEDGRTLEAQFVIGADGARSAVRESAGLQLEGPRTRTAFVIVDVAEDPLDPLPEERIFHYEHPGVGYRSVLFVPFAGHWRVDLQCLPGDDPEAFSGAAGVRQWLPKVMPARYADRVTWVSTYIFRQAIASSFTDEFRRVLLAGEAAHIFAPFGARGLNSGMADAFVAAAAIDTALSAGPGADASRAIDHVAETRRAAAERNRAASNTALRHLTVPDPFSKVVRRAAGLSAPWFAKAARWMDKSPYGPGLGPPDADGMEY